MVGSDRAGRRCLAILAEPTLILVLVGISLLAKSMLPFVVNHLSAWRALPHTGVPHICF